MKNATELNMEDLYAMQKELDAHIIEKKGLQGQNLLPNTVLALQVEIAEMANEWRGFKHWSEDQEPRREKLLAEYVDCLHFFLSIANQLDLADRDVYTVDDELEGDTVYVLTELFSWAGKIAFEKDSDKRRHIFKGVYFIFINLGHQRFEFTWEQIAEAYLAKHAVNLQRQASGY